jgi:hypothetical protein
MASPLVRRERDNREPAVEAVADDSGGAERQFTNMVITELNRRQQRN